MIRIAKLQTIHTRLLSPFILKLLCKRETRPVQTDASRNFGTSEEELRGEALLSVT